MTNNYICIDRKENIRQVMRALIRQAGEHDNISTIYVVDEDHKFCGAIDLKDLILDMAGNVGTQSLAVTIRVLMDENTEIRRYHFDIV